MTKRIKLGVTGFSRSGKTVFIGSLAQALLTAEAAYSRDRPRARSQFGPFKGEYLKCASIRHDIHSDVPQFPFRSVREALTGSQSAWPTPTEGISHLVVDLDIEVPRRFFPKRKTVQLDLIDYPGEWLADFQLLSLDYDTWAALALERAAEGRRGALSHQYLAAIEGIDSDTGEEELESLADLWSRYLQDAASEGLVLNQPARLLRPDNLQHSPVLRLIPIPASKLDLPLAELLRKRFDDYKTRVVTPFYKNYFANIDRQIVLVDVLRTLELGEQAYNELLEGLHSVLQVFRFGNGSLRARLFRNNTTHLLFAATKADHVVRGDRTNLREMLRRIVRDLDEDNQLKRAVKYLNAVALASVQSTEDRMTVDPPSREVLFGQPRGEQEAAWDPGGLPLDVPPDWEQLGFQFLQFEPGKMPEARYYGFPSINLGEALHYVIGEDLL